MIVQLLQPAVFLCFAFVILYHLVLPNILLMHITGWCDCRLRQDKLLLLKCLNLHQLTDDDHQRQIRKVLEDLIALQVRAHEHELLRHDVAVPHFAKVVFVEDGDLGSYLRDEPRFQRVEYLALVLHEVQNGSIYKFGVGDRQVCALPVVLHQY